MVNLDLAYQIANEMDQHIDLNHVAQNVVEKVKRLYRGVCWEKREKGRIDDITLIIRNFNYPMGTKVGQFHSSLSHPYPYQTPHSGVSQLPSTAPVSTSNEPFNFQQHTIPPPAPYPSLPTGGHSYQHQASIPPSAGQFHYGNFQMEVSTPFTAGGGAPMRRVRSGTASGGLINMMGPVFDQGFQDQRNYSGIDPHHNPTQQPTNWVAGQAPNITTSPVHNHQQISTPQTTSTPKPSERGHQYENVSNQSTYGPDAQSPTHQGRLGSVSTNQYVNVTLPRPRESSQSQKRLSDSALDNKMLKLNLDPSLQRATTPPPDAFTPTNATNTSLAIQRTPTPKPRRSVTSTTESPMPYTNSSESHTPHAVSQSSPLEKRDSQLSDKDEDLYGSPTGSGAVTPTNTSPPQLLKVPSEEKRQDSQEEDPDMGFFSICDESEASEISEDEGEDGLIKSYVKFEKFPLELSWDDVLAA